MKKTGVYFALFLLLFFMTKCKIDKEQSDFVHKLEMKYGCEIEVANISEKYSNEEVKKYYAIRISDCEKQSGLENHVVSGIALEAYKINIEDNELAGIIVEIKSKETRYEMETLKEVIKAESYMIEVLDLLESKNYNAIYKDFWESTKEMSSEIEFTAMIDSIRPNFDFTNLHFNNFTIIKQDVNGKYMELIHAVGVFGKNKNAIIELYVPLDFQRKIYGINIVENNG